ncbi:retrovirus-related pol polyprotein from transposon TNT 1-94 [Tanacetum coccineum]
MLIHNKATTCSKGLCIGRGIDSKNHFAPVLAWMAVRIFCAYAAHKSFPIYQMDVKMEFLNGPWKKRGVIKQDDEKTPQKVKKDHLILKRYIPMGLCTSGGIQFLGDKLVSWMSKKQNCTAMSSAEAEYVALSASCAQVMWDCRKLLQGLWLQLQQKYRLYCDSQVENGIIELYFVRTEYQLADMFTKALPEERFQYLVRRIGMRCLTPAELEGSC